MSKIELARLLDGMTAVEEKLIALEERKSKTVIRAPAEELSALLSAQQPLLMQFAALENKRQALQDALGIGKEELFNILGQADTEEDYILSSAFLRLRDTSMRLKKLNDLNGRVVRAKLETKKNLLYILGIEEEQPTYTR